MRPYRLVFTVRHEYFDAIVRGDKTVEFRRASQRWVTVYERCRDYLDGHTRVEAVFICGGLKHEREVVGVERFPDATHALGREPSEQGARDLGSGEVVGFRLGGPL